MTFLVIEGIEGSGKSTLVSALAGALRQDGHDVVTTREPGGTAVGDAVRDILLNRRISLAPLTEAMLVNAARAQHVCDLIKPALAAGRIVLCDRFIDSTLAYQGYGRGISVGALREVCSTAASGLQADLTLLLDLPLSQGRLRLKERSPIYDRIEAEGDAFHERVRKGFLALARGSTRHRVIDATQAPERVLDEALSAVRSTLGVRS